MSSDAFARLKICQKCVCSQRSPDPLARFRGPLHGNGSGKGRGGKGKKGKDKKGEEGGKGKGRKGAGREIRERVGRGGEKMARERMAGEGRVPETTYFR